MFKNFAGAAVFALRVAVGGRVAAAAKEVERIDCLHLTGLEC